MNEIFIYTLTCPFSGKIYYVGQTRNISSRVLAHSLVRKYVNGQIVEKIPIIEEVDRCDEENKLEVEAYWIYQFLAWGFTLSNRAIQGRKRGFREGNPEIYLLPGRLNQRALQTIRYSDRLYKKIAIHLDVDLTTFSTMLSYNDKKLCSKEVLKMIRWELRISSNKQLINLKTDCTCQNSQPLSQAN